jgi:hypothetical protein
MKKDHHGFNLASKPSGDGCLECLASPKGGFISVGVRSAGTSDAVTVLRVSIWNCSHDGIRFPTYEICCPTTGRGNPDLDDQCIETKTQSLGMTPALENVGGF